MLGTKKARYRSPHCCIYIYMFTFKSETCFPLSDNNDVHV